MPDNPAYEFVLNPNVHAYFEANPTKIKPLSLIIEPHIEGASLPFERIKITDITHPLPPWELKVPVINFGLAELNKPKTNVLIFQILFQELVSKYPVFEHIYTDGSKTADAVGAASVTGKDLG